MTLKCQSARITFSKKNVLISWHANKMTMRAPVSFASVKCIPSIRYHATGTKSTLLWGHFAFSVNLSFPFKSA